MHSGREPGGYPPGRKLRNQIWEQGIPKTIWWLTWQMNQHSLFRKEAV